MAAFLAAPPAGAQGLDVTLRVDAPDQDARPGDEAAFHVRVENGPLPQSVEFVLEPGLPVGWTFNFTPASFDLKAHERVNATLTLFVPGDAVPGLVANATFHVRSLTRLGQAVSAPATVNVTVTAPPAAEDPAPPTPAPPRLDLFVTNVTGEPGQEVEGFLRLVGREPGGMRVSLAISGRAAWAPFLAEADQFRVVYGEATPIAVHARIPAEAAPGSHETFTLTATVEGNPLRLEAPWRVTVLAPTPPPATEDPGDEPGPSTPTTGEAETDPAPSIEGPALTLAVSPGELLLASGDAATALVTVTNTGTEALHVRLQAVAGEGWAPPTFSSETFDLSPGASLPVTMRVQAPPGLPLEGAGSGQVMATAQNGLVRSTPFALRLVPPGAPAAPAGGTETQETGLGAPAPQGIPHQVMLGIGLGTLGAGALVLSSRPTREKILWLGVGLYTRLARPDVLGHEERERLYTLVERMPGIHFHALQRDLGWNTGTLTYHVRVLERHGFIVSRRDGFYRRFYLSGAAPRKETFENKGPSGMRADVLEAIRNQHGLSQTDLALLLGANKQTVNYHVKALERTGAIRLEKRGRETILHAVTGSEAPPPGEARA